jgi:hypothetical protein
VAAVVTLTTAAGVGGAAAGAGAVVGVVAGVVAGGVSGGVAGCGVTATDLAATGEAISVACGSPSTPANRLGKTPPGAEWRRKVPVAEFLTDNDKFALGATKAAQMPPTVTAE